MFSKSYFSSLSRPLYIESNSQVVHILQIKQVFNVSLGEADCKYTMLWKQKLHGFETQKIHGF